jgi:hypothetical protein
VTLWILPPVVLIWTLISGDEGALLLWGAVTMGMAVLIWTRASVMMKGNPLYGLAYPLGSIMAGYIFLKSWWRGTRIEWKGRTYEMPHQMRTHPSSGTGS